MFTVVPAEVAEHPILRGVPKSELIPNAGPYMSQPLSDTATPLILAKGGDLPAEPIAYTNRYTEDSRIFYTSSEIGMIGEQLLWMRDFMSERDWLVAGDFNYPGSKQVMEDMAEETDLVQLDSDPKSTFKRNLRAYANSYDHIYVFDGETTEYEADSCDTLDVTKLVYGSNSMANMRKSKRELSDHLPVFAIFDVTQADDD